MNIKRYLAASFAIFAFVFLYEWLVHGFLLMNIYQETPHVWRDSNQMMANLPLEAGLQLVLSFWFAFAFSQLFPSGGIRNGLFFGLYFGVFAAILTFSWFFWLPVSSTLAILWFVSSLIEGVVGGIIVGSLYKLK